VNPIRRLHQDLPAGVDAIGAKAHGLVALRRLGLPVPAGFVIGTAAGREARAGRLADGLRADLAAAVAGLEAETGREFGGTGRPRVVSVRSGAAVSMPGMMSTVLGVGLTTAATAGLAAETGDARFAADSRERFARSFAAAGCGAVPEDPVQQLERAVVAVLSSWDSRRARTYRELNGVPHDSSTAVVVQVMVFGNRDARSGAGVAFSRDPVTGAPGPSGEVVFGGQGDAAVSGGALTRPLAELRDREPRVWARLRRALERVEAHHRDACCLEFTAEAGALWLLQVRVGGFVGDAAIRVAVDLVDEGRIDRAEALLRVSPEHVRLARQPRLADDRTADVLATGIGAGPGVAVGRVATSAAAAVGMAGTGPVVLVRPETSPLDMAGIAAAAGLVTARGGPASHAAVVARSLGRPAVVGIADLLVGDGSVRFGGREVAAGALVSVDGTGGRVVLGRAPLAPEPAGPHLGRLLRWADEVSGGATGRPDPDRLRAARAALGFRPLGFRPPGFRTS
jgi:pyruvate,orthophosphate dikinase